MCGICGTTRAGSGGAVAAMNAAMRHRGPDDEGVYEDPVSGVMLGARRLSVIDVAGGHQPLGNEDGTVWAALNGEIYNHPSLRSLLVERGHRVATGTDTEVLVHLYEEYGDELVHALEGMYAFAIWDARGGRLLLGRDRFGEKPLFYLHRAGALTFASELTALCAGTSGGWDLDADAVDSVFTLGYVVGPGTILTGPRQLPPGHVLIWERATGRVAVRRYWAPAVMPATAPARAEDLVSEARAHLEASVRSRLIADVPLGVFLSGGVDSTLVAAVAARQSPNGALRTFTVGYDVGDVNETEAARHSARAIGADHHEVILTTDDVGVRAPRVLSTIDQPLADQALIATHAVAECARREVTVAVGGEGADELFGGYPRYRWLARSAQLERTLPRWMLATGAAAVGTLGGGRRGARLRTVLAPASTAGRQLEWVTGGRSPLRQLLYGPRMRHLAGPVTPAAGDTAMGTPDGVAGIIGCDQAHWLPDDVLAKADRAGMLASLEIRTPFLSRSLAEFATSLPVDVHLRQGGKWILRSLLRELLPDAVSTRRKTAFRVPAAHWLRGPLAPLLRRQLDRAAVYDEGWFDRDAARHLADEHLAGRGDWSGVLWPLLVLGTWVDHFRGRDDS
jgi:asparagine synthase (glutamine-hydrolysing)